LLKEVTECYDRIIPQATSVRYGLSIGARCVPVVLALMYLFGSIFFVSSISHARLIPRSPAPIAWPIAKLLDYVLGKGDVHTYKKAELKSFLQFHRTGQEPLRDDEISILNGVLELNSKKVETIMTPMKVSLILSRYSGS
jgi:metal transporter CNNM